MWFTSFVIAAVTLACRDETPAVERRTARAAQPDSALTSYIEYYRDWMLLANRHKVELDAEMPAIEARYSHPEAKKLGQDPHFMALIDRQRREMQPVAARAPRGMTAQALEATLPGIGMLVLGPQRISYVPGHNEAALAAARAKYGDKFVGWVLAHEDTIVTVLSRAAP